MLAVVLAVLAIYSSDAKTAESSIRECPSVGVSLTTRKVVVGLNSASDAVRADCGWYRYIDLPKPDDTHYWRATNYLFVAGTATPIWREWTPPAKLVKYSKLAIITRLEQMNASVGFANRWLEVKAKIEELGLKDKWDACTFIAANDPNFVAAKPFMAAFLGMTEKQLDDWLNQCLY